MARISKYLNQTKTINDVVFSTITYFQNKVEVIAEGYEGSFWIGTQTWKKYMDGGSSTKGSSFHPLGKKFLNVFKKITKKVTDKVKKVTDKVKEYFFKTSKTEEVETPKLVELFPMPLLIEHKTVRQVLEEYAHKYIPQSTYDLYRTTLDELDNTDIVSLIMSETSINEDFQKKMYYEMLRLFHPDMNLYPDNNVVVELNSWFE